MNEFIELGFRDGIQIDFDVVAKKEDVDLLRDAVLEMLDSLGKTDMPEITVRFGPVCDKLLDERANPK